MSAKGDQQLRAKLGGVSLSDFLEREKRADDEYFKDLCWYHGKGTNRRKAETLLADKAEGTFLVRESYSCPRDLVLSVCEGGRKVGHYKIERNENDVTYFKLESSSDSYVQGLENFIQVRYSLGHGLPCRLTGCINGQRVPPACLKTGRTNLLHEACSCGSAEYVKKILKDKNCPNIDNKDAKGSTALHIASAKGNHVIIGFLLKKNASVDAKDVNSYTPLHVACRSDANSASVALLCTTGDASLVARTYTDGLSALHVAAENGCLQCVQQLLAAGAPYMPRDRQYLTPYDVATKHGHSEVAAFLNSYECPPALVNKDDWFHALLDRQGAEKLLTSHGKRDGLFLVRKSSKKPNNYAVSLCYEQMIFHYEIKCMDNKIFFIDDSPFMTTIEHLVEHFCRYPDGLCCSLRFALTPQHREKLIVWKKPSRKGILSATMSLPSNPPAGAVTHSLSTSNDTPAAAATAKTHPAIPLPPLPVAASASVSAPVVRTTSEDGQPAVAHAVESSTGKIPVYAIEDVIAESELGQGEFGSVMKGYVVGRETGVRTPVAVKTLHDENIQKEDFLGEARVMFALSHRNIVKLIGICEGPPVMIIQELVAFGSMLDYIWDYPGKVSMKSDLNLWAAQIACGMMYLESKGFVHRDLAARNILLQSKTLAKISDFGLSRAVGSNSDYYKASKGGRWPVKWYAPESINYGTFSHASDVWSYGVTLYEMFSYGEAPYDAMSGAEVLSLIERGGRLSQPKDCPNEIYELMRSCWLLKPADRPSFRFLYNHFASDPAYEHIRSMLNQQQQTSHD